MAFQGPIFSFLHNQCGISIKKFYLFNCLALSILLILIAIEFSKSFGSVFGILFFLSCFLSPWITVFARNLYWCAFTWFLPVYFAFKLTTQNSKDKLFIYSFLLFISYLLKMLLGFEYITSIILFAASISVILFFTGFSNSDSRKKYFLLALLIFVLGVLAFVVALVFQSFYKADSLLRGLELIKIDAMKRTFGSASSFDPIYTASLNSSVLDVLKLYFNTWHSEILFLLPGRSFAILNIVIWSLVILISCRVKRMRKVLVILLTFLLVPLSWFILARPHSYIHTHMNYVLFYLGYMGALCYALFVLFQEGLRRFAQVEVYS